MLEQCRPRMLNHVLMLDLYCMSIELPMMLLHQVEPWVSAMTVMQKYQFLSYLL